jgi:hypothetical protein
MAEVSTWDIVISILSVVGTWIGVYLAYRAIKKDNKESLNRIENIINSNVSVTNNGDKRNLQIGSKNKNVQ